MYGIVSKGKTDFLKLNSAMIKWMRVIMNGNLLSLLHDKRSIIKNFYMHYYFVVWNHNLISKLQGIK